MPHRILQIIPSLDRSGAEKQMSLLATRLPRDEFEVHVCALTRGGPLAADLHAAGIPVTVIGKRWKFDPLAYWRLEQHVRRLKPDLVQTWLFAGNAYGRAAALRSGVPVIVASERCVDPWKQGYQHAIDRFLARRTAALVVNSAGVRAFYQRHGIPPTLLRIIPNGVEVSGASPLPREALLEELGLPARSRLIAAVGRLWPQKRVKDLIWATDLLKVIRDDVHLLVIGDGPQRAILERYRHLCRLDDHVHFLGLRDDVPSLLPHCDLLWLASQYEGMPNVVLEAMAAGIPVVATNIPGTRDLVVPGETGYLVAVGQRAEFARWASKLLDDPELAKRLGAAGRARVAKNFSVEAMVDRFAALYRELLQSKCGVSASARP
jgi:glycosyltransferase involved in cell wall biosynthesis